MLVSPVPNKRSPMQRAEVIVLCGGRGIRMGPLTDNEQKCMFVYHGKPILEHLLDVISDDFRKARIILAVGYKHQNIKKYFGARYKDLDIEYTKPNSDGTKEALIEAEESIFNDRFYLIEGDAIIERGNLRKLQRSEGLGSIFCCNDDVTAPTHPVISHERGLIRRIDYTGEAIKQKGTVRWLCAQQWSREIFCLCRQEGTGNMIDVINQNVHLGVKAVIYEGKWHHFADPGDMSR